MTDLLATSADTWRDVPRDPSEIPAELVPPVGVPLQVRLAALRRRHRVRQARAEAAYAASRNPEHGWPVADYAAVWQFLRRLVRGRQRLFVLLVLLNAAAAFAALLVPRLLGSLIDETTSGTGVDGGGTVGLLVLVVVAQAGFTFWGQRTSAVFGQDLLSAAREYIVRTILGLPLGRVEGASTGDLVTRVTRDVGTMSRSVQYAVPMAITSVLTVSLSIVAMLANSVFLAVPSLLLIGSSLIQIRRYLHRAQKCYIAEGATYSRINSTLTETVEGARTVEALRLGERRIALSETDTAVSAQAERYGMTLRNLLFAVIDFAFNTPRVVTVLAGAYGYAQGWVTLGQITAAVLYVEALSGPLDRLVGEVDRLQVGAASTSRLLGIAQVPQDRVPGEARPEGSDLVARDLRFAYREGHDVLHGVSLRLWPGERLAVVGPSGSGKSTLGRLLSGINAPRTGRVTVGGVDLVSLPLETLRTEVALVTQEHHVFVGSVRDNIVLAREDSDDDSVWSALAAVGSADWVERLPAGLDTVVGSGSLALTPAQAQQVALARLIIADPHTLVLDEATSLIDPRTARTVEGSMNALLHGRTVVAIAHRLHTAHDADRIAVVIDGRIVELGSHSELVALGGEYAALWQVWTS
ncbi:MAG TPA: ABC transporter ATP-binding protein [Nocardioides sp.]|uniref:ABC transporter ATP-binding protein n=1 Tax=Nocardioides sp. TaxID=35761 RepID=UPI002C128634|nr:ABC transporter ATP-binding protein [Nocardioides sp.]HQR28342.1 ABC transporter ATP-binding protein [Nocardioides sp.]